MSPLMKLYFTWPSKKTSLMSRLTRRSRSPSGKKTSRRGRIRSSGGFNPADSPESAPAASGDRGRPGAGRGAGVAGGAWAAGAGTASGAGAGVSSGGCP